jgi:hypothetical protein
MEETEVTELENQEAETQEVEAKTERTFTQAELNAIVQKRVAKAEKRAMAQQETPKIAQPSKSDYESEDEWLDAKLEWREQQRALVKESTSFIKKSEDAYKKAEKLPEFDRETFNDYLEDYENVIKPEFIRALVDSDKAPELMAYINMNPTELNNLEGLSSARQAAYIGKLETKLEKTMKEPNDPMTSARGSGTNEINPLKMSPEQYREYRAKQGARWAR